MRTRMVVLLVLVLIAVGVPRLCYGGGLAKAEGKGEFSCPGNLLADGGFEGGSPNASWTQHPVGNDYLYHDGAFAHSGDWFLWLGRTLQAETIEQTVTIPQAGGATLEFYLWNQIAAGLGSDVLRVKVDGITRYNIYENTPEYMSGYTLVSVDIPNVADGDEHTIAFEGTTLGTTRFFIDDVCLTVGEGQGTFWAHSGANLPWINYGWDLGENPYGGPHGGFSANTAALSAGFGGLEEYCVGLVRVFLFGDVRTGIEETKDGTLSFDGYVYADMDALLAAAQDHGLRLMPVLVDYLMADGINEEKPYAVGERPEYLTTERAAFVALLSEFLACYGGHPAIYAWDVMNEPELVTAVDAAEVRSFVQEMTQAIHTNTQHLATVGSWHCDSVAQWQGAGLDFYQFHYYDYMAEDCPLDTPAADFCLDKPIILGEVQPTEVQSKLQTIEEGGYSGALFWSVNADYDFMAVAPGYAAYFHCGEEGEGEGEEGEGEGEGEEGEGEGEGEEGEGEGEEGEGEGEEGEGEGEEGEGEGQAEGEGEGGEGEGEGEGEGSAEGGMPEYHSADQDSDNQISLSELLRVIQFYNSDGYHCEGGTEDGYAPGQGDTSCGAHGSDYNAQNWYINLSELLRLIQFYNSGGYHACAEGEDGFCPGPPV